MGIIIILTNTNLIYNIKVAAVELLNVGGLSAPGFGFFFGGRWAFGWLGMAFGALFGGLLVSFFDRLLVGLRCAFCCAFWWAFGGFFVGFWSAFKGLSDFFW